MADTRNQNEWSAVFLAAAELSRRGYCVALTLGPNAPLADLVVRSPQGKNFIVDVKGKGRSGRWCVKPKAPTPNLFYILVRLGMTSTGIDRRADTFFVMSQRTALQLTKPNRKNPSLSGFSSQAAAAAIDDWGCLPT